MWMKASTQNKGHPLRHDKQSRVSSTPAEADKYILSGFRLSFKEDDRMSQIGKLYEAYCKEHEVGQMSQEALRYHEILSSVLPHKEYTEVEELMSASLDDRDKEYFFAGFRAATRLWAEAMK